MSKVKVHVNNVDEKDRKSELFYRCRTTEIQINGITFKTPFRSITRSELNAKKKVPIATPLLNDSDILFLPYKLGSDCTARFLSENQGYSDVYTDAENVMKRGIHASLPLILVQPCQSGLSCISRTTYEKFLRMTFSLETTLQNKESNLLAVPHLGNLAQLDILKGIHDNILEEGMEPIFFLDLKHDEKHFKQIVDFVKNQSASGTINLLGLIFHPYEEVAINYDYVWDTLKNENIAIIMTDVKRKFDDHLSCTHFSEYRLGDIFCIENGIFIKRKRGGIGKITTMFFDRDDLGIKDFVHYSPDPDKIAHDLAVENNSKDMEYLHYLLTATNDEKELSKALPRINYLSKIHEVTASKKELAVSGEYINDRDSAGYIKDKKLLHQRIAGLCKYM